MTKQPKPQSTKAGWEERFDREFPKDKVIVKMVGKIYGTKFVTEELQQVEAVDREKVKNWIASELAKQREEIAREIEGMRGKGFGDGWDPALTEAAKKVRGE